MPGRLLPLRIRLASTSIAHLLGPRRSQTVILAIALCAVSFGILSMRSGPVATPALAADRADSNTTGAGGRQIGPFSLLDTQGVAHTSREWRRAKAVVLFFIGAQCPVSNGYAPEMQRLATRFAPRGVAFYGVHCDATLTAAEAAEHAKQYGLSFVILLDDTQRLARDAGVRVTPEAVVAAPDGRVLYRGRIDDRYTPEGRRRDEARVSDLENALNAILDGKPVALPETRAWGCPVPRLKTSSDQ